VYKTIRVLLCGVAITKSTKLGITGVGKSNLAIPNKILPKSGMTTKLFSKNYFLKLWIHFYLTKKTFIGNLHLRLAGVEKKVYCKGIHIIGEFGGASNLLKFTRKKSDDL